MKSENGIVFYGTPDFAVASLEALVDRGFNILCVVTAPDRPAGRGLALKESPVKKFAISRNIPVLQPEKLKSPDFFDAITLLGPVLQIVVAFRMLPKQIWNLPVKGTFNLHASLLPDYRGAAPINHAVINGETETGVTTFFIEEEIDTGNILFSEKTEIGPEETAGELHDRLMMIGASLVVKTTSAIFEGTVHPVPQQNLIKDHSLFRLAPKLTKPDCRIDWNNDAVSLMNQIRGLSPYPAAFSELTDMDGHRHYTRIFRSSAELLAHPYYPGEVFSDGKSYLKIAVGNGFIHLLQLQPEGRRTMQIEEFLRGYGRLFVRIPT